MDPVTTFFHWPDGGVWSNLLASAICVGIGFVWQDLRAQKRHDKLVKHIKENK